MKMNSFTSLILTRGLDQFSLFEVSGKPLEVSGHSKEEPFQVGEAQPLDRLMALLTSLKAKSVKA